MYPYIHIFIFSKNKIGELVMLVGVDPDTMHTKIVLEVDVLPKTAAPDVDDVDDTNLKSTDTEEAPNKKAPYVDPREATPFVQNRLEEAPLTEKELMSAPLSLEERKLELFVRSWKQWRDFVETGSSLACTRGFPVPFDGVQIFREYLLACQKEVEASFQEGTPYAVSLYECSHCETQFRATQKLEEHVNHVCPALFRKDDDLSKRLVVWAKNSGKKIQQALRDTLWPQDPSPPAPSCASKEETRLQDLLSLEDVKRDSVPGKTHEDGKECTSACREEYKKMTDFFKGCSMHWEQYWSLLSYRQQFMYPNKMRSVLKRINKKYFLKPGMMCAICRKSFRERVDLEAHTEVHLHRKVLFD